MPRRRPETGALFLWAGLYIVACCVLLGLAIAFGWVFWLAMACAIVIAAAAGYVYLSGSMWWITGAGEPVVLLRDGVLNGRIRPVRKGDTADAAVAEWWDFTVAAAELTGVRLSGSEGRPVRRTLVIGLPAETSTKLVADPATAWYAQRWLGRSGSPAVWPVGRMLPRPGRADRVRQLLDDLRACMADR